MSCSSIALLLATTSLLGGGPSPGLPRPQVRLVELTGDGRLDVVRLHADGSLQVAVNLDGRSFLEIGQTLPLVRVTQVGSSTSTC
jgi:hypothetical protein